MMTCAVGAIRSLWQAGQRDLPVSVNVDASLRMPPGDREVHGAGPSCGSMSRSCTAGSDRGPGLRCCRQRRAPRPEDRCSGTAGRWMPKGRSGPGWRRTGRTGRSCIILRLAPTSERDGPWSTPLGGQRLPLPGFRTQFYQAAEHGTWTRYVSALGMVRHAHLAPLSAFQDHLLSRGPPTDCRRRPTARSRSRPRTVGPAARRR